MSAAAGICAARPGQCFFFGGFDLGFSEGMGFGARGFGAETRFEVRFLLDWEIGCF